MFPQLLTSVNLVKLIHQISHDKYVELVDEFDM